MYIRKLSLILNQSLKICLMFYRIRGIKVICRSTLKNISNFSDRLLQIKFNLGNKRPIKDDFFYNKLSINYNKLPIS